MSNFLLQKPVRLGIFPLARLFETMLLYSFQDPLFVVPLGISLPSLKAMIIMVFSAD
jgi:hypothetical protein